MVENKDDKGAGGEVGLPAGARIGKYEIVERIGIGGQSIVYKGYDSLLNRHVAMKQVSSHLAGDKRFIERFRREAQILARLGGEDSGIVAVYDLLENQSGLFVVMEYVPGHSLHKVLEHQRYAMPVGVAMEIIWRIANGLRVAHAEGIVHRDIKPGNVLITRDYGAKITDFGVAATVGGEDSIALGTTKYMAPELFSGSTIDARVDIYSLGFIAYEMLTGREFFGKLFSDVLCDGRSENLRWMKWHADAGLTVPELAEINELVPRGLSDIIAKMMAKDPNRRYATIDQVLADLRRISDLLGRPAGRIAAGLAVEQHAQPTVPVSAEVQVEEPPTAVVPKMPMSSKKKLVLSLSVGGLVVISALLLAGFVIGQRAKRADLARQAYEQARDRFAEASALYQDGELGDCQVAFEDAQARFERGDVDYSDVSGRSVQFAGYADMCRAWTAMIGGQWDKADHLCKQVVDTASGEMPGDLKGQIDWFKSLLPTRRSAAANLEAAEKAIAAKDIEDADREMAAYGRLTGPPADLNRWAVTLSEALAAAKIQLAFDRHMAAGDTARDSGEANLSAEKFDQAKANFERAIDLYTQAKGLFDNEMVAQRIGQIHQADLCRLAMQEYAVAWASQDLSGQIAALRAAIAVRPIEPFMEKLSLAQAEQAYQQGQTHRIAGGIANLEKAVSAFKESLVYASSDKVKVALAEAETELKRARLIADGDAMMQAKRFLEAVELYEQAVAVGGVDQLAGKLADARIQMHFAAGETSRVSKRWGEALQAYERARQEIPDDEALAARVQRQSELIAKEKSYYEYLDAGQALMRDKRYQDAAKKFARAEALAGELSVPAGEAAKWHSQADYALQLERGKAAQKAGNLTEALAYYRMAQRAMDTEEIRNLIAAIEAAKKQ